MTWYVIGFRSGEFVTIQAVDLKIDLAKGILAWGSDGTKPRLVYANLEQIDVVVEVDPENFTFTFDDDEWDDDDE